MAPSPAAQGHVNFKSDHWDRLLAGAIAQQQHFKNSHRSEKKQSVKTPDNKQVQHGEQTVGDSLEPVQINNPHQDEQTVLSTIEFESVHNEKVSKRQQREQQQAVKIWAQVAQPLSAHIKEPQSAPSQVPTKQPLGR